MEGNIRAFPASDSAMRLGCCLYRPRIYLKLANMSLGIFRGPRSARLVEICELTSPALALVPICLHTKTVPGADVNLDPQTEAANQRSRRIHVYSEQEVIHLAWEALCCISTHVLRSTA